MKNLLILSLCLTISAINIKSLKIKPIKYNISDIQSITLDPVLTYKQSLRLKSRDLKKIETKIYLSILERTNNPNTSKQIKDNIFRVANENSIPVEIIYGLIQVENPEMKPSIVNWYGAVGLLQVVDSIHAGNYPECGNNKLTDIYTNLCYGSKIFKTYLNICRGNLSCTLWRYNGCTVEHRNNKENCTYYPRRVLHYANSLSE